MCHFSVFVIWAKFRMFGYEIQGHVLACSGIAGGCVSWYDWLSHFHLRSLMACACAALKAGETAYLEDMILSDKCVEKCFTYKHISSILIWQFIQVWQFTWFTIMSTSRCCGSSALNINTYYMAVKPHTSGVVWVPPILFMCVRTMTLADLLSTFLSAWSTTWG